MRLSVPPFAAALALLECGGGPLPLAQSESPASLNPGDADVANAGDAGSSALRINDAGSLAVEASHTITVTLCSKDKVACLRASLRPCGG
jgi:hypothetical protein